MFSRRKIEEWAGSEKVINVVVESGDKSYVEELVKFMYTEKVPYSEGNSKMHTLNSN